MWWDTNRKESGIESAGLGVWEENALHGCCVELFLSRRLWEVDPCLKGSLTYFAEWRVDVGLNPESRHGRVLMLAYGQASQSQSGVYSVSPAVSFSTVRKG